MKQHPRSQPTSYSPPWKTEIFALFSFLILCFLLIFLSFSSYSLRCLLQSRFTSDNMNVYRRLLAFLGRPIGTLHSFCLHKTTLHKDAETRPCLDWDSNQRPHYMSGHDSCFYCDRLFPILLIVAMLERSLKEHGSLPKELAFEN
jgi:hypothetical protein